MKEHIQVVAHTVGEFFTSIFINHPEGMFLYCCAAVTINGLNLWYKKAWDEGSRLSDGNSLWGVPEQLLVVGPKWLYPHILAGAVYLPEIVKVPEWAGWFMMANTFFALTGKDGLNFVAAMKGVQTTKTESSVVIKKEVTKADDEIK